jgi:hypothetical protein
MDEAWMGRLMEQLSEFATATKLKVPSKKHHRGSFTQVLLGMDHGTGENFNVMSILFSTLERS